VIRDNLFETVTVPKLHVKAGNFKW